MGRRAKVYYRETAEKRKAKLRKTAKTTENQMGKRAHKAKKVRLRVWGAERQKELHHAGPTARAATR